MTQHPYQLITSHVYTFTLSTNTAITARYDGENDVGFWCVKQPTGSIIAINPDQVVTITGGKKYIPQIHPIIRRAS